MKYFNVLTSCCRRTNRIKVQNVLCFKFFFFLLRNLSAEDSIFLYKMCDTIIDNFKLLDNDFCHFDYNIRVGLITLKVFIITTNMQYEAKNSQDLIAKLKTTVNVYFEIIQNTFNDAKRLQLFVSIKNYQNTWFLIIFFYNIPGLE